MLPARHRKTLTCHLPPPYGTCTWANFRYLQVLHWAPCQVPASQGAQHITVLPGEGCFDQDFHLGTAARGQGGPGRATQQKPTTQCD